VFVGVPEKLEQYVRSIKVSPSNFDIQYPQAGLLVALHYIQINLKDKATRAFLKFETDDDVQVGTNYRIDCRMVLLGEILFNLRNVVGFSEICRRFKRDIRVGTFEAMAAGQFHRAGYEIFAQPETGKKGDDFDFQAAKGDEVVNVEVTALTAPEYSEKTILDALNKKRKQLPKGKPAVIFCIIPDAWYYPVELIRPRFDSIRRRFFGATERISGLVIMGEDPTPWSGPGWGVVPILVSPFANARARHPFDPSMLGKKMTPELREAFKTGKNRQVLREQTRQSEFYSWVDSLILPAVP
jgi:hypothetical protein